MHGKALPPIRQGSLVGPRRGRKGEVWYVNATTISGQRICRAFAPAWTRGGKPEGGALTKKAARDKLAELIVDGKRRLAQPGAADAPAVTLDQLAQEWMEHGAAAGDWRSPTIRDRGSVIRLYLLPAFGGWTLDEITTERVERWRARQLADGRSKRQLQKAVGVLHGMYAYARRVGLWRGENPASGVSKLRIEDAEHGFYSPPEVVRLLQAARNDTERCLFGLSALAGLRFGEALAVRVGDIDLDRNVIRVERSVDPRAKTFQSPKSRRSRVVPLVPPLRRLIEKVLERQDFISPDDLLLPTATGGVMNMSWCRRKFQAAAARAGLPKVRMHDLRASFLTACADTDASPIQIMRWAGHQDLRVTMRYLRYRQSAREVDLVTSAFAAAFPDEDEAEVA